MHRDSAETSNHHAEAHEAPRDVLEAFAQTHFDLSIDASTHERWGDAIPLMQKIDGLVAKRNFIPEQAFSRLFNTRVYAKRHPSLNPIALGDARHGEFTEHIETILGLGEFALHPTTTPGQYIEAREIQAYAAVKALGCIASDELRNNSVFLDHYLPAVTLLAAATVLRDSMRSSLSSYRRGKLGFLPEQRHDDRINRAISRHDHAINGVLLRASSPAAIASQGLVEATSAGRRRINTQGHSDLRLLEA